MSECKFLTTTVHIYDKIGYKNSQNYSLVKLVLTSFLHETLGGKVTLHNLSKYKEIVKALLELQSS